MTDQTTGDGKQIRPFAAVLQDIQGGTVADEAAERMQELVAAVTEHGKKGDLTLKITVQPLKGNASALSVSGELTLKAPKPEPATGIFFYDAAGNLMRDDPRQAALPGLRRVDLPANEPKDIAK